MLNFEHKGAHRQDIWRGEIWLTCLIVTQFDVQLLHINMKPFAMLELSLFILSTVIKAEHWLVETYDNVDEEVLK